MIAGVDADGDRLSGRYRVEVVLVVRVVGVDALIDAVAPEPNVEREVDAAVYLEFEVAPADLVVGVYPDPGPEKARLSEDRHHKIMTRVAALPGVTAIVDVPAVFDRTRDDRHPVVDVENELAPAGPVVGIEPDRVGPVR